MWELASLQESLSPQIKADVAVEVGRNRAIELAENPGTVKPKNSPKIDPAKVAELRAKGKTHKQIADEVGCAESSVSKSLSNMNPSYHGKMDSCSTTELSSIDTKTAGNSQEYLAARLARDSFPTAILYLST